MRESRREDKEVGWLPLHNKQLILSISSRLGEGNTVSKPPNLQAAQLALSKSPSQVQDGGWQLHIAKIERQEHSDKKVET